ncbi:iron dicitrate transporter FecR [Fulvitalea axinellae]|uniref:Iron dicitrate transporter FecR n=1 Tax=Fulvitalea axinellae TaxID=1182444 RepID=A0AAU9CXT0_9BACT|nr:iron dicitrate transporter FecR [Fulvitalea axinellae]
MKGKEILDIESLLRDDTFLEAVQAGASDNETLLEHFRKRFKGDEDDLKIAMMMAQGLPVKKEQGLGKEELDRLWLELPLEKSHKITKRINKTEKKNTYSIFWKVIAAAVVSVLAIAFGWQHFNNAPTSVTSEMLTASAPLGKRVKVELPDGSIAQLNGGSQLTYPKAFGDSQRNVSLKGKAFFDVTRNETKPFRINAGALQVEVLGTSFDVSAYTEDQRATVGVTTGKVRVKAGESIVTLTADEKAVFERKTNSLSKTAKGGKALGEWVSGKLRFEKANMSEICKTLSRHYGVHTVDQYGKNVSLNGVYANESLTNVLRGIRIATGIDYRYDGTTVTFVEKK